MRMLAPRYNIQLRSKQKQRGGYASVDGVGIIGACDADGNIWTKAVKPQELVAFSSPGAGVKASANSFPATNIILKSLHASLSAGAAATAIQTVQLIATNTLAVNTVIWQDTLAAPANSHASVTLSDLNIDVQATMTALGAGTLVGVNGLTLAFLAAPAAAEFQSVSLTMYDTG